MQQFTFAPGDTSKTIDIFLPNSSSTTGAGLTGLVYNSSNLAAYYRNTATGTVTVIDLATQTVGGAYSSGGFVELDATHAAGMYRLDLPDAVLASAGNGFIYIYGATNLAPTPVQIVVGYPAVNVTQWAGAATATDDVALTTAPTNFSSLAITAAGGVTLADGVTHGGTTAMMRLGSSSSTPAFYLTNSGGPAWKCEATAGNNQGAEFWGSGSGGGVWMLGGSNGNGLAVYSQGSASALLLFATGTGKDALLAGSGTIVNGVTGGAIGNVNVYTVTAGAIADASFAAPTADPSGLPSTYLTMVQWVAQRLGLNEVEKTGSSSGTIVVKRADGSTARTTNAFTVSGSTETVEAAS